MQVSVSFGFYKNVLFDLFVVFDYL